MPAPHDPSEPPARERDVVPATPLGLAGQALLDDKALGWRVEASALGFLQLYSVHGRVALLEDASDDPARLPRALERLAGHSHPPRYVVVLGEPSRLHRVKANSPDLAALGIWLHCADGVSSWENRAPRWGERRVANALKAAAAKAFARRHWSTSEADAQARRIELDRMLTRAEAFDLERYRDLLAAWPRATLVLLGLILFVFGLEALWGGVDLPPLLMRMGSLVPERALAGEWWRFVACTFLHGGALHVALNAVALWMLGRSLEPLLGTPRFLFIYFASGLAGSAASSCFVSSQSVGASGAIWGLLGAHAALAFYPRPLLPLPLVGLARRAAATNLVFNLVVSFSPDIDAAAHVGGGLMGALLLVLMALSGGLSSHGRESRAAGSWVRVGAAVLAVTFLVGCVRGIIAGRPWQLDSEPELARIDLPGSPWSVMMPRGQERRSSREGGASRGFGNLAHDPSVVDIRWVQLSEGPSEREPNEQLSILMHDLATVPDGLVELMPPRIVRVDARPARSYVAARYRYVSNTELVLDSVVGIVDGARVSVEVTAWAALPHAFDGLAPRILRSFEPLAASTASLGEPRRVSLRCFVTPSGGRRVKVRRERSLLDRRGEPFPESGTMDATLVSAQRCLEQRRALERFRCWRNVSKGRSTIAGSADSRSHVRTQRVVRAALS